MKGKTHVAYMVTWTESERGWGQRPDGASLHLSQEDVKKYIKRYWDSMPADVPDEYSRPDDDVGSLVAISPKLYKQLKSAKKRHGYFLFQHELREARNKDEIVE